MSRLLELDNLSEELRDYIADNSGLGYVVGTNLTLENTMDFTDIGRLLGSRVLLTIFDEGGAIIPSSRFVFQDRNFRFVTKGTSSNQALGRGRDLFKWLWNKKTFGTSTYRWWLRPDNRRMPQIISRGENKSFLADFIFTFFVFNKV
jgi:hypothetical protein